jgi:hypothetical protein
MKTTTTTTTVLGKQHFEHAYICKHWFGGIGGGQWTLGREAGGMVKDKGKADSSAQTRNTLLKYRVITNDVSYYINILARIAHIICNHLSFPYYVYLKPGSSNF